MIVIGLGYNCSMLQSIAILTSFVLLDHKELFKDLHEVAPKWQMFGVHLKVPYSRIQGFSGGDGMVERCFTTMLAVWLEGETAPTVDRLMSALRMPGVDHGRLASEIDKNRQGEQVQQHTHYHGIHV